MTHDIYLTAACPDQIGITAAVSQFIADKHGLIIGADHHTDLETQCFFMRYVVRFSSKTLSAQALSSAFAQLAKRFGMTYQFLDQAAKPRVLLMASRESHTASMTCSITTVWAICPARLWALYQITGWSRRK